MTNSSSFQVYNASAGSGKTFTLVKEYLKILLTSDNNYKFQQILAVTFTNKAAGEMKERVIKNLHAFSKEESNNMLEVICDETNLVEGVVFKKSQAILNAILQNYSGFSITTIDSFTHKLIRTFAHDLKLPLNFDVEMDAESLLNEAVDVVISKIGEDEKLTNLLVNYAIQKLDDDKAWDITDELKNFARIILNEDDAKHLKALNEISIDTFKSLKEKLQKENKNIEAQFEEIGANGLVIIKENRLEHSEFSYSGELPKHFIKLTKLRHSKIDDLKFEGRLNTTIEADKNLFAAKSDASSKQTIESISPELKELYFLSKELYEKVYGQYILNNIVIESLIPLAVLSYINSALQDIKNENNILLNAEFNQLISATIKNEPAPFIYERIGEKFRYYFIDEMQDTSELQWQNIIPLIDNVISSENEVGEQGKLLLVGDAKQSIYRWRGGKAEQFIALASEGKSKDNNPFYVAKNLQNLDTNYRSYSEVIHFNNSFFKHISQFLANKSFSNLYFEGNNQQVNTNVGGYVQLSFVEKEKDDEERDLVYPKKVLNIIQNLDANFQKNEVCVLVRTKKQGIEIANYLSENEIEIISSETLLLRNNKKVNFIVDLLEVIQNSQSKECKAKLLYYLYESLNLETPKHQFLSHFINLSTVDFFEELKNYNLFFSYNEFIQSPFYESIEYIIRSFNLAPESDSDIQFFLDFVFEYQQSKQVSINGFLEKWELKKDKLSIVAPEAENAVRIMTIHKAKGLEFPVVIFPYDIQIYNQIKPKIWYNYEDSSNLKSVLVNYSDKLKYVGEQGEQLHKERRDELELDNFNILYVALTRASEQLYIVSERKISSKNEENLNYISGLFINFLKEKSLWNEEQLDYSFGDLKRLNISIKEDNETTAQSGFISNSWKNHNISIVANSSLLWDTEQGKAIIYGNLIHEILSKIKSKSTISEVVNQYLFKGVITSNQQTEIEKIINNIINHKQLSKYFDEDILVYNEQEIVTNDKNIMIPDRLIVIDNEVTIMDYKTGNPDRKYHTQVTNYAKVLEELNYVVDKKLLVYINEEITVEEV